VPAPFPAPDFDSAVAAHLPSMQRTARSIVASDDLAWDAVQEVLLRVWRRGYLPPEPRAALCHLVSLAALQQLRGRGRRDRHESAACRAPMHRPAAPDPADEAERAESGHAIAAALTRLPADQRLVFRLFELHGHDYACIAEQLGVPVGTVRSRLSRARARLREELDPRAETRLGIRFRAAQGPPQNSERERCRVRVERSGHRLGHPNG